MHQVEAIVREGLADSREALEGLKRGEGMPPGFTIEDQARCIADCEKSIAAQQEMLDDPTKMQEWWDSLDEGYRAQNLNR